MGNDEPRAVLLTGVYGSGKSSVAMEMADVLEERDQGYAMLDLDFIDWFAMPGFGDEPEHRLLLANLASVMNNYRAVGVPRYILARSFREASEIEDVRTVMGMPMTIVRLTTPFAEIERRLEPDVTTARKADLAEAAVWLEAGTGEGLEDVTIANDRSIRDVALEVLRLTGWA